MSKSVTLIGEVVRKRFGAGSKSDRMALFLKTAQDEYVLRQKGGHAYSDPELAALVGKRVRGVGTVSDYTFLLDEWEVLDSE